MCLVAGITLTLLLKIPFELDRPLIYQVQDCNQLVIDADVTRTVHEGDELQSSRHITAQAVMGAKSHELHVYDDEREIVHLTWNPRNSLGFVTERVWHPQLNRYRTRMYEAAEPWGTENLDHPDACMFGVLLSSWLAPGNPSLAVLEHVGTTRHTGSTDGYSRVDTWGLEDDILTWRTDVSSGETSITQVRRFTLTLSQGAEP